LMLIVCLVLTMAGCSKGETTSNNENTGNVAGNTGDTDEGKTTHVIVDHLGNEVEVPNEINRIVVCGLWPLPSVLCVFFDSAEKIVGIPDSCMSAAKNSILSELYPEILNAKTEYTTGSDINMEELMKLNPDIVIYNTTTPELHDQLEAAGIPGVAFSVNKWNYNAIETLKNWIALLSEMFPENDKVDIVNAKSDEMYNFVQERVADIPDEERERAFFLFNYNDTAVITSGSCFFGQFWADAIGVKNVAEEITTDNSVPVNMEQIYAWNPSLIFITNFNAAMPEDLYENNLGVYDFTETDAVKNKNCFKMPLGMYRSFTPGVDTPLTLLYLAKCAYPEKFEDIDMIAETIKYYKEVFGVTLTQEQAERIFAPDSEAAKVHLNK
ncbi:MAG: ABC transporter substrate-binding protein, partial [Lachnospiraceae bacterium]|nr:ABC transporter substrate-binding protein [Lachnospiraceae bacterium]